MGEAFEYKDTIDYKAIDKLGKQNDEILIGFFHGIHDNGFDPVSDMADDAMKLSLGAYGIPARPFLEDGMEDGKTDIQDSINKHYKKMTETGTGDLYRIAAVAVGAIQRFVHGDYYKSTIPNSPATIDKKSRRQKGEYLLSDRPLIDSANMINSLTSVINGVRSGK